MNAILILAGILSCLVLTFNVAQSFTLAGKDNNAEHHLLLERPSALSSGKFFPVYQDEDLNIDSSEEDEHNLEKRRFNAWAGKRSLLNKRRFNAWAGR